MLALYRSGRQADALEQYRLARATFGEELGLDPSRELDELQAAMLRQDENLAPPVAGRSAAALPQPPRPLVGRELELAAVVALARAPDARLVTLTGPGGTGKTRLALEAARELDRAFAGGAHFVDLAPARRSGPRRRDRRPGARSSRRRRRGALRARRGGSSAGGRRSSSSTTSSTCSKRRHSSPSCSPESRRYVSS